MSVAVSSGYRVDRPSRHRAEPIFAAACLLATLLGVALLAAIALALIWPLIVRDGVAGSLRFLIHLARTGGATDPSGAGVRDGLLGSLWIVGVSGVMAIPVGIGAAIWLEEYAAPGGWKRLVRLTVTCLAGVPPVLYGVLGLSAFTRGLSLGLGLAACSLTITLMILPPIVLSTRIAFRAVPRPIRFGAMALGATRWQVIRDHVLPAAASEILSGTLLTLSRAIGEAAPLLILGAVDSIRNRTRPDAGHLPTLPVELYQYARSSDPSFVPIAAGGALLLVALIFSINLVAIALRDRPTRPGRG